MEKCRFCDWDIEIKRLPDEILDCSCRNCGNYRIERDVFDDWPKLLEKKYKDSRYLASGYIRERAELGLELETITMENYKNIFSNSFIPDRTAQKLYKTLLYVYRKTEYLNQNLDNRFLAFTPAIAYAKNDEELTCIITSLEKLGYLDLTHTSTTLTLEGMDRAEKLLSESARSEQCFVAMWFHEEIRSIYDKYISRAVIDAGFKPIMIALEEFNDDICDKIMAEIKRSRFVIADFTGHRGGVYFEAGYAYGLGLPVIWTCRNDWFNTEVSKVVKTIEGTEVEILENRQIHFDIEHFNFILWETGEELYDKIKNRILASLKI
jgi:hypothetical protein